MKPIKVITSQVLDAATKAKIEAVFIKKHTEKVSFEYEVNPNLLGGILVIDNGQYYDGSIKNQLVRLKDLIG